MNRRTKIWTYGVAYLSLAVGSGVSIAGNVADTYRTSLSVHHVPDGLDITVSAFWPAAVLLAIEMFVSRLWPARRSMQAVRWFGCLGIGFVAMYASWFHLSDLMASRGQDSLVSSIGPLAIDGLAVMATALILSNRGHVLDTAHVQDMSDVQDTLAEDMSWTPEDDVQVSSWMDRLSGSLDSSTTPAVPLDIVPVSVDVPSVRTDNIPAEARTLILDWMGQDQDNRMSAGQLELMLAETFNKSTKTIQRWRKALA